MTVPEELKQILNNDPENFRALYSMSLVFQNEKNYAGCFAMVERAISSYENAPLSDYQSFYFELKRLHTHLLRNHMEDILGPAYHLLDPHWIPVFKLGRPREMAWTVTSNNISYIQKAMNAPQLRKLRYLSVTFKESPDVALNELFQCPLSILRTLSLSFRESPNYATLRAVFSNARSSIENFSGFSLKMPKIDDSIAILVQSTFKTLDALSLTSNTRTLSKAFCEVLADDPRSNQLTRLALIGSSIGNQGLFTLFASENFGSLQVLDLRDGLLTNAAARIVLAGQYPPHLRTLDVRYNTIDPAGIDMLSRSSLECLYDGQHERPQSARP